MAKACRGTAAERPCRLTDSANFISRRHQAAAVFAFSALVLVACALLTTSAPSNLDVAVLKGRSTVHPVGVFSGVADAIKAGAHARLISKAAAAGDGHAVWNKMFSTDKMVSEAAKERLLQLSAMRKQQDESRQAVSDASQEFQRYDVLSFKTPQPPAFHSGNTESRSPSQAADDAESELSRYGAVASSGSDAYAADKEFARVEKQRSSEHTQVHSNRGRVPTLNAASDLLARYSKLASSGVTAYRSDSEQSRLAAASDSAQYPTRPTHQASEAPAAAAAAAASIIITPGTNIRVLSQTRHWRPARVEDNRDGQLLVHYEGYKHEYDEWIPAHSTRIKGLSKLLLKARAEKAKAEVAQEFSQYANVAASGQHAYEADSAAAAAGSRWDNHKQYVADEMRGDRRAQQLAARYSQIARLGTPEDATRKGTKASSTAAAAAAAKAGRNEVVSGSQQRLYVHPISVVQAAARAAESAATSVVEDASAAVEEVEGSQASHSSRTQDRPEETVRAKFGGAQEGRGRLGDSTERTYAEVGHMLALAAATANTEGNAAVSKQVAQEEATLAKLRNVPGKLPVRVQHSLVSAGASLLRRLGLGAGAAASPQALPLTANEDNDVLAVSSEAEGPAVWGGGHAGGAAKARAMQETARRSLFSRSNGKQLRNIEHELHQLKAAQLRLVETEKAARQRLDEVPATAATGASEVPATAATGAPTQEAQTQPGAPEVQVGGRSTAEEGAAASGGAAAQIAARYVASAFPAEEAQASVAEVPQEEQSPVAKAAVAVAQRVASEAAEAEKSSFETRAADPQAQPDPKAQPDPSAADPQAQPDPHATDPQAQPDQRATDPQAQPDPRATDPQAQPDAQTEAPGNAGQSAGGNEDEATPDKQGNYEEVGVEKAGTQEHAPAEPSEPAEPLPGAEEEETPAARPAEVQPAAEVTAPREGKWQDRKIPAPPVEPPVEDECWLPKMPQERNALCSSAMIQDGTCAQVWGDVPDIMGAVEAFAIKRVFTPSDSSKLHLEVLAATIYGEELESYGTMTVGYQKRADGAMWQYKDQTVAAASPWSTIGFFTTAPDMVVKDCHGSFLGVISMENLGDKDLSSTQDKDLSSTPSQHGGRSVRATIMGPSGKESLTVIRAKEDVLGDKEGLVRYHVYTTDTRALVGVMSRRDVLSREGEVGASRRLLALEDDEVGDGLDWVVRLEIGGPLDVRVAGLLVAQLTAEQMHQATDTTQLKKIMIAVAFGLLALLLCCFLTLNVWGCITRRNKERNSRNKEDTLTVVTEKHATPYVELPHTAGPPPPIAYSYGPSKAETLAGPAGRWMQTGATRVAPTASGTSVATTDASELTNQHVEPAASTASHAVRARTDFWDRLPAFEEPEVRARDYYQAPVLPPQTGPSYAAGGPGDAKPLQQPTTHAQPQPPASNQLPVGNTRSSTRIPHSVTPSALNRYRDTADADKEHLARKGIAKHQPKGWQAASFRESSRSSQHMPGDNSDIRGVLHGGLVGGSHEGAERGQESRRRPKSLREWAEKYDFVLPPDQAPAGR